MKIINKIVLSVLMLVNTACAGTPVNVKLHVVDDDNIPVDEARVGMGFLLGRGGNSFRGFTDTRGYLGRTDMAAYGVKISVKKDGYYDSQLRTERGDQELTMVLRQKKNPIAMYAKNMTLVDVKRPNNIWIGYDFIKGDFLPPYGEGEVKDFEMRSNYIKRSGSDFSYHLEVQFPNDGDGLVLFSPKVDYSNLKSDYVAPATGYQSSWKYYDISKPGVTQVRNLYDNRDYYLRIRSEMDVEGNVVSAYYGKIYAESNDMIFYLNPTINDRNVEFDINKNLFKNLSYKEDVSKP